MPPSSWRGVFFGSSSSREKHQGRIRFRNTKDTVSVQLMPPNYHEGQEHGMGEVEPIGLVIDQRFFCQWYIKRIPFRGLTWVVGNHQNM